MYGVRDGEGVLVMFVGDPAMVSWSLWDLIWMNIIRPLLAAAKLFRSFEEEVVVVVVEVDAM